MTATLPAHVRATVAGVPAAGRRAWSQRGQVAAYALLSAALLTLALVTPRLLAQAADEGLRRDVADAGAAADLEVTQTFVEFDGLATELPQMAQGTMAHLPAAVAAVVGEPVAAAVLDTGTYEGPQGALDVTSVATTGAAVRWVEGAAPARTDRETLPVSADPADPADPAPAPPPRQIEIGLPAPMAEATGLHVGDVLTDHQATTVLTVVGVFEPVDPGNVLWRHLPGLRPLTELAPVESLTALVAPPPPLSGPGDFTRTVDASVWARVEPGRIHAASTAPLLRQLAHVVAVPQDAAAAKKVTATTVESGLPDVVDRFDARLQVARAQVTTKLLGLASGAVLVLWLGAGMLVARRRDALALERARGASLPSFVVRAVVEAMLVGVVATGFAVLAAAGLGVLPSGSETMPAAVVLAAVVGAPVVLAVLTATATWNPRRVSTDRRRRAAQERIGRSWAVAARVGVVVLAAGAVSAAGGRGFDGGVDPYVAAAPVLLAAGCTVVVLLVVPACLRLGARLAARRRGVVPLVAASRAATARGSRGSRAVGGRGTGVAASVLSVVVVTALAVFAASQAATVQSAQRTAMGAIVGADARVDGPDAGYAAWVAARYPALDVHAATVAEGREFPRGSGQEASILAVDDPGAYPQFAALARADGLDAQGRVPALVDARLLSAARGLEPRVSAIKGNITVAVVGTVDLSRTGPSLDGARLPAEPVIVVDRAVMARALGVAVADLDDDVVWLDGPDAAAAAQASPGVHAVATTRAGAAERLRTDPLVGGVTDLLRASVVVLALLGAVAVALTVVAGARDRLRVLAVLRTLGVPRRAGRGLAFGELAPVLAAAVVAGSAAGVVLTWALTPAQGLGALASGGAIVTVLPWWGFAAVPAAVLATLAVGAWLEERRQRHARVGAVLRTW